MFIRTKVVKGFTYHQVVRSQREGAKVRQVIVAHLGTSPTVGEALKAERKRLARRRRERGYWPATIDPAGHPESRLAKLARLDGRISESTARVELLTGVQETMEGKPERRTRSAN